LFLSWFSDTQSFTIWSARESLVPFVSIFSRYLLPHPHISSPFMSITHQDINTHQDVKTDESPLVHHCNSKSVVNIWGHSWYYMFHGFGHMYNEMHQHSSVQRDNFTALNAVLCTLSVTVSFSILWQRLVFFFYC
jgi:hypothetical protein